MKRILILCPLRLELEAMLAHLANLGKKSSESQLGLLKVFEFNDLGLLFSLAGHGKTQFGIQAQFFIDRLKPDVVICAGSAGGLSTDLKVGDVVVAEKTIEHDFRERFLKRPEPEFAGDTELLTKLRSIQTSGFQLHFGKIASGDEDIVDATRAQELVKQIGAIACAWEGAGGARACQFNRIPFLEIRGVTDSATHESLADFKTSLKSAMAHVCEVILQLT
jgi:adenosylhomocysteine nucleosidase